MLFSRQFSLLSQPSQGDRSETVSQLFSVFRFQDVAEQTWVAAQLAAKKLPIRARSGDATQVFINDLNLKLQKTLASILAKTLNCWLNLHQYWLRSRKLHSFTFQTYLKVDHWRRWWFTDHDDINSGEIGFDKNIRFLSLSNKIMEEISHFYINMKNYSGKFIKLKRDSLPLYLISDT